MPCEPDALHVFEDAARMQTAADLSYYVEPGEEKIGEKRACARIDRFKNG